MLCRLAWIVHDRVSQLGCALESMDLPTHSQTAHSARKAQEHSIILCLYPEAIEDGHDAPIRMAHPHLDTIPEGEVMIQRCMRSELQCVVVVEVHPVYAGGSLVLINQYSSAMLREDYTPRSKALHECA